MNQKILEYFIKKIADNSTMVYMILANVVFAVFSIWFSNIGILPFKNISDFIFFSALAIALAIYRPSWTFALFIGSLPLEITNLAPNFIGLTVRSYQFFAAITIIATIVHFLFKRLPFDLPKWHWIDLMPILFAAAGFISSFASENFSLSFKQSVVALSFVAIYFLVRIYVQTIADLKKISPFFISSSIVVMLYSIWQNVRFLNGADAFEVMPGRPNGTFTEPDWLGIYLVFVLAVALTIIYTRLLKTKNIFSAASYLFVSLIFIVLILTAARSAWLGAAIVVIGFLKIILTNGSFRISKWRLKEFFKQTFTLSLITAISLMIAVQLTNFQVFNRLQSTGGQQKITISCDDETIAVPESISSTEELVQYGCKHINLEDIEKEKSEGKKVLEVGRPDPSVNIRADIYKKTISQIKDNPIFGLGWGSISNILGVDENGNGLNASNIFLEIWLGAGALGLLSFVLLLVYIFIYAAKKFFNKHSYKVVLVFILLGWVAILIPNMFNSGIFLGFLWAHLAIAVSLILNQEEI